MLLHTPLKRYIVCLGVAPKWMKKQDRVLITHIKQPSPGIGHEESMAVVYRIPQLESKHCICLPFFEGLAELSWGKAILIKAIIVLDGL
jgi:hypothetical protein